MEKEQQRRITGRTTETNNRDPSTRQRESDAIITQVQTLRQESDCYLTRSTTTATF